jgi:DNA modification methylase
MAGPLADHPCIESASICNLTPSRRNVRTHSKRQIGQLADSIKRFGWLVPIVIDEHATILCGHARTEAAKVLGLKRVPVIVRTGLTDAEKRALAIADNKIAANAGWDLQGLAEELAELSALLPEVDLDVSITGFETVEIDKLHYDLVDPEEEPSDQTPTPSKVAVTRAGDVWRLGQHRLACGDARDGNAIRLLMRGAKAAMGFADPPYNVPTSTIQGRGRIRHPDFMAASGEMSSAEFTGFLATTLGHAAKHCQDGAIFFVFTDWRHFVELHEAGNKSFAEKKNVVVWNKTNAGQGTFYRSQYELIFVFKVGNVWTYAGVNTFRTGRMDDLGAHPTVKPVALVADAMRDCSRRGDIILDPFMGSGTTIMAAERVGRRAYGMELDPVYVDVAIRRWQAFTKQDAVLEGTSKTFDDVATARGREKQK